MISLSEILQIKEIGEGVQPYQYSKVADAKGLIAYAFKGKHDTPYIVKFEEKTAEPGTFALSFYTGTSLSKDAENRTIDAITNRGDVLKVLSTVVAIVKDAITSNQDRVNGINWIGVMSPDKEVADAQRDKLYLAYLKKNIESIPNWVNATSKSSAVTKIRRKQR